MIFQNKEIEFFQQVGEECTRAIQQPDVIETKQFGSKI